MRNELISLSIYLPMMCIIPFVGWFVPTPCDTIGAIECEWVEVDGIKSCITKEGVYVPSITCGKVN